MGSCYNKVDKYFFPQDTSQLFSFSLVAPFNAYRVTKFVLCGLIAAAFLWNEVNFIRNVIWLQVIYLTEWSLWVTFLYFVVSTADLLSYRLRAKSIFEGAWKLQTVLFLTALVNEFVVTIVFWSVLFQYESKDVENMMLNFAVHLLPLIALSIDAVMNPIIVKNWRLQIYVILIDVAYFVVNIIYSLVRKPVYPPINYKDLMSYVYIAASFALGFLQFWIFKFLVVGKLKLPRAEEKLSDHKQSLLEDSTESGTAAD